MPRRRPREGTDWPAIAIVVGLGIVGAFQFGKAAISLVQIQVDLDVDIATSAWLISAFGLAGSVFGVLAGSFVRRVDAVRVLFIAAIVGMIGSLVGAAAPNFGVLLGARLVEAVGFLLTQVAAPSAIAAYAFRKDRSLALGIWGAYMPIGLAACSALAPLVLVMGGWRALWVLTAVLFASFVVAGFWFLPPLMVERRPSAGSQRGAGRVKALLPPKYALTLGVAFMVYSLMWIAIAGFLPTLYLSRGLGLETVGAVTATILVTNVVGNVLGGVLARRTQRQWRVLLAAYCCLGLLGVPIFLESIPIEWSIAAAIGFSTIGGVVPATVLSAVPRFMTSPSDVALANGTIVQVSAIGSAVGPLVIGAWVSTTASWVGVPMYLAAAAAGGALLTLRVCIIERRGVVETASDAQS